MTGNKQIRQQIDIPAEIMLDLFLLKLRQLKSNNSCISKDILMNIDVHRLIPCSVRFHEIRSVPYQKLVL